VPCNPAQSPKIQRDALGQSGFQIAYGLEVGEERLAMGLFEELIESF
jgi:hypothetical protein